LAICEREGKKSISYLLKKWKEALAICERKGEKA
jgi:hypothetical protein